jgi:phage terminase large subunit-like protein
VVLALDGSFSQDCTALVVCEMGDAPQLESSACGRTRRSPTRATGSTSSTWRARFRDACRRWRVLEVTADPFRWQRSRQVLADERIPVSEYPQSPARNDPGHPGLYEAVIDGQVTHSGDRCLARHVANAVLKDDTRGSRLLKKSKHSTRRIDLAVAAVMAHSRAVELARRPKPSIYVG